MKIGTIESIWRYPVKGMRGEEISHVYTGFAGLMGDRVYGVIAADGDPAFPWHTGRDQEEFVLYEASFRSGDALLMPENLDAFEGLAPGIKPVDPSAEAFKVDVKTPGGATNDIDSPEFLADLQETAGRSLKVHMTQKGQHDCRPVSIFSLSAAAKLGEEVGMEIDKRRFRANFYVEWENQDDPYYEFSLVGKNLKIGERLEVAVIERDPRCKMITLDPDTSEESPKLLQHVSRNHGGDAGVFAAVLQEGRVKKGDPIFLT
ncbi:MOSC N-terminal beta barrel domain-containing protein [Pelagibius sp. Alg239-R121]|uniref:MOSC domain-containing protein n=1 Tax=Pelagibius sp. Alg239-R121 TaxID=2993448 RepID=UPI0024A77C18|nr:MOSC N-terminal beta barrel domain-containing protein [Pelagibius sp. Alg239-R121]